MRVPTAMRQRTLYSRNTSVRFTSYASAYAGTDRISLSSADTALAPHVDAASRPSAYVATTMTAPREL